MGRRWCIKYLSLFWHAAQTVTQVSCLLRSFHDHQQQQQQYSYCYISLLGHCFCSLLHTSISRLLRAMAWLPLARFLLLRSHHPLVPSLSHSSRGIQTLTSWNTIPPSFSRSSQPCPGTHCLTHCKDVVCRSCYRYGCQGQFLCVVPGVAYERSIGACSSHSYRWSTLESE